jgi:hypothetical protein
MWVAAAAVLPCVLVACIPTTQERVEREVEGMGREHSGPSLVEFLGMKIVVTLRRLALIAS